MRRLIKKLPPIEAILNERDRLAAEAAVTHEALLERNERIAELERLIDDQRLRLLQVRNALEKSREDRARFRAGLMTLSDEREALERRIREQRTLAAAVPGEEGKRLRSRMPAPPYATQPGYLKKRRAFLDTCIERARLNPDHAVLDMGSGMGGIADLLTEYLNGSGTYEGIDVDAWSIAVCSDRITADHPNFTFAHADVLNGKYNPEGVVKDTDYRFPFDDHSFDTVILRSVFTHMLPSGVDHYLGEITRVLRPGGRAVISYFLYDEALIAEIEQRPGSRTFANDFGHHRTDRATAESAVAYEEAYLRRTYHEQRLVICEPILYGSWRGSGEAGNHQDIVIAVNEPEPHGETIGTMADTGDPHRSEG